MSESEPTNGRFLGYKPPSYEEAIDKSFQAVRRADSVRRKENKPAEEKTEPRVSPAELVSTLIN
jgi:hypothetical protein